jgi:hypothetical protein
LAEPAGEFLGREGQVVGQRAEDGVDEAGEMSSALVALAGDLDRRVDGAVGGGALSAFDDSEAEGVADRQRRGFAEVFLQELVGGFQVTEHRLGQAESAGAVGGSKVVAGEVRQHPAFAEDPVQDCDCCGACHHPFGHYRPLDAVGGGLYQVAGPYKEGPDMNDELPPAAKRALAEAEERRKAAALKEPLPKELGGRDGPEPVRYGDWEKKGLAVDF